MQARKLEHNKEKSEKNEKFITNSTQVICKIFRSFSINCVSFNAYDGDLGDLVNGLNRTAEIPFVGDKSFNISSRHCYNSKMLKNILLKYSECRSTEILEYYRAVDHSIVVDLYTGTEDIIGIRFCSAQATSFYGFIGINGHSSEDVSDAVKPYISAKTTAVFTDSASSMRLSQEKLANAWISHVDSIDEDDFEEEDLDGFDGGEDYDLLQSTFIQTAYCVVHLLNLAIGDYLKESNYKQFVRDFASGLRRSTSKRAELRDIYKDCTVAFLAQNPGTSVLFSCKQLYCVLLYVLLIKFRCTWYFSIFYNTVLFVLF